uniref:NB-ARC domain-containing protein n=1 Tax=Setaria viridis TaxID=4556 RepID=A0A4U6TJF2_SETVI|nr:hypothetical protein SEVIR_8G250200v2 [Setaria viridis]
MMKQGYGPQEMTKILDMSYSDLPLHLKSCFLYLSTFSENCTILKDCLIRRWIAEGFIPLRKGESLWSVGESYFKELARRGLLQLVLNDINDEIGCTIHNIIHEFIRSLSTEENFVGEHLSSISYPCDTVRRFTRDCSKQYESGVLSSMTVHLSKVRSLAVSGNTNKQLSDVSTFKLVWVLDLEGATGLRKRQLRSVRSLVLLRYLSLRGTDAYQLPREMKALQHLETVDLRQTNVNHLPQLATAKLVSLLGDHLVIPRDMDDMLELEELFVIVVSRRYSMVNAANIIRKSKLLRVLGVRFESCDDQMGLMPFLDAVNYSNLQTFVVDDYSELHLADGTYELHPTLEDGAVAESLIAEAEAGLAEDPSASTPLEGKPRSINPTF